MSIHIATNRVVGDVSLGISIKSARGSGSNSQPQTNQSIGINPRVGNGNA